MTPNCTNNQPEGTIGYQKFNLWKYLKIICTGTIPMDMGIQNGTNGLGNIRHLREAVLFILTISIFQIAKYSKLDNADSRLLN